MPRYFGKVGYATTSESAPGVWTENIIEKSYYGDVLRNTRRLEGGEGLNDDLAINNSFSVMADAYAYQNFFAIRYIRWMGACWKVTNVEVQRPRLLLTVGGVYNGATPGSS